MTRIPGGVRGAQQRASLVSPISAAAVPETRGEFSGGRDLHLLNQKFRNHPGGELVREAFIQAVPLIHEVTVIHP
jgi:hypothetical protein